MKKNLILTFLALLSSIMLIGAVSNIATVLSTKSVQAMPPVSVIGRNTFIASFNALNDANQRIIPADWSPVVFSVNNGKLEITADSKFGSYKTFGRIDFNGKTIDISKNKKMKIKLNVSGFVADEETGGTDARFIFRLYQEGASGKYISWFQQAPGSYELEIDFSTAYGDNTDANFDFTKINALELANESYTTSPGVITIESLQLGDDMSESFATLVSFDVKTGVEIGLSPAKAGLSVQSFKIEEKGTKTQLPISEVSTTDEGSTYLIKAPFVKGKYYDLTVTDAYFALSDIVSFGSSISVVQEQSIITEHTFISNLNNLEDDNQLFSAGFFSTVETQDEKLIVKVDKTIKAYDMIFRLDFNGKSIDVSNNKTMKLKLKTTGFGATTKFVLRTYQEGSPGKYLGYYSQPDGANSVVLNLAGWGDGVDATFDFTKVSAFELITEINGVEGVIEIESLQVGKDIILCEPQALSFTVADGVCFGMTPPTPDLPNTAIKVLDVDTQQHIESLIILNENDGASFTIKADFVADKYYSLLVQNNEYYATKQLTFSDKGFVTYVAPKILVSDIDKIVIACSKQIALDASNFELIRVSDNTPITITSVIEENNTFAINTSIDRGTDYNLIITKDSYYFGLPTRIRLAVNPVIATVDWENQLSVITADHWGMNDIGPACIENTKLKLFFDKTLPGVMRIHHAGLVSQWVDNSNKSWKEDVVRQELTAVMNNCSSAKRIMLTLDDVPGFIGKLPLTEAQEDEMAAFFAELPKMVKRLGLRVDLWEFLNEKENAYSGKEAAYWRMLNKVALKMKAENPGIKCGGPAISWPNCNAFIDNCGANMDFVSAHLYTGGENPNPGEQLFSRIQNDANTAGALAVYAKQKGYNHLETFLDEFNVSYAWIPYEPRHHNNIGASWMALFIKKTAITGITGMNIWNALDGAFGLNYNSAPAQLYLMSPKYLRGYIVESDEVSNQVEMLPVDNGKGGRSVLMVNKTSQPVTVLNAADLLGGNMGEIHAIRLDSSTFVENRVYDVLPINPIPTDITLYPFGMVLITNIGAEEVEAPYDVIAPYVLDDRALLQWNINNSINRRGFKLTVNGTVSYETTEIIDTTFVVKNLEPNTDYTVLIETIDELGNTSNQNNTSYSFKTRHTPLRVNDATKTADGEGVHQFKYDFNWVSRTTNNSYNFDNMLSKGDLAVATIVFEGSTVALYGSKTYSCKNTKIYIDDVLVKEYRENQYPLYEMFFLSDKLADERHVLKIETDANFSLDRLDIYGSRFENVTQVPDKVNNIKVSPSSNLLTLSWDAPASISGIQYYVVNFNEPDSLRTDTVYSPQITITDLIEEQQYNVSIDAYDPCGNVSRGDVMVFSTIKKVYTEVPQKTAGALITIDGEELEPTWDNSPRYMIKNAVGVVPESTDCSGWFKMLWEQKYLYILVNITDNKLVSNNRERIDETDGFELYIDAGNKKSGPYTVKDIALQVAYAPDTLSEMNGASTFLLAKKSTSTGYIVEMRFTLSDMSMAPGVVGKEFGFDIHINDNDKENSSGLDNKLTWQQNSADASLNKALLGNMKFVVSVPLGAENINNFGGISLYPNPVDNILYITNNESMYRATIYDSRGIVVKQCVTDTFIDVSFLQEGSYFVELKNEKTKIVKRFVKK